MEVVYFRTDTSEPVGVVCTRDGKINFHEVGIAFGLEWDSITLCALRIPKGGLLPVLSAATWTQIKKLLDVAGTKADPVPVCGRLKPDASTDLTGIRESLKRLEDVIGISLICVKRELMFTTSKQSSRPGNGIFKEKLINYYGVDTTNPLDPKKLWTPYIRCMVTNHLFIERDVAAAHLIGYSKRHYAPMLLGITDLDSPRNGLLLLKSLEDAFDDSRICFSYKKLTNSFILHILDAEYLDKKLSDKKGLSEPSRATLGDTTFGDLARSVIIFRNTKRPLKRALHFHARHAITLANERGTLPQAFCVDSWDFDYGSARDYKDVVDRWFTSNAEYDGSKKTKFVDEDLALLTSEGWSEDQTITPEAESESWSEDQTMSCWTRGWLWNNLTNAHFVNRNGIVQPGTPIL